MKCDECRQPLGDKVYRLNDYTYNCCSLECLGRAAIDVDIAYVRDAREDE